MSQNYNTFTGKLLNSLKSRETENEELRKFNLEMSKKVADIEKTNILLEKSLKDCLVECQHYKEIASKAENFEYTQSKILEELDFFKEKNTELSLINSKLEKDNYDLLNQKYLLESEIERLNYIIHQLENKVIELNDKNSEFVQKFNKTLSSEHFERKIDSFWRKKEKKQGGDLNNKSQDITNSQKNVKNDKNLLASAENLSKYYNQQSKIINLSESLQLPYRVSYSPNEFNDSMKSPESRNKLSQSHKKNLKKQAYLKLAKSDEYNFGFSSLTSPKSPKPKPLKTGISNFEKKEVLKLENLENLRTLIKKTQEKINSSIKPTK